MPSVDERKARNETIFRRANEEVRHMQEELEIDAELVPFICECEDEGCREVIRLSASDYERVRANPTQFIMAPEHPSSTGDVVERHEGFWVTEKRGVAAEIAAASDPRQDSEPDERARRIGENEVLYRTVNEKIEGLNRVFGTLTDAMTVVCECGRVTCAEQIELDVPTYERVRSDPSLFVIVPGHDMVGVEAVLEHHQVYDIVRKNDGPAARVAEAYDPRA